MGYLSEPLTIKTIQRSYTILMDKIESRGLVRLDCCF
jgi:hypothetical protein